jgi:chromate transporter
MAIGAAAGLILVQSPVAQILAIAAGAVFGLAFLRDETPSEASADEILTTPSAISNFALIAFALLLGVLPFLAAWLQAPNLGIASVFYRTGALVFGSGHVVLPLLQGEVVGRGWVDQDHFLAGYGAMQALPGPLFGFAGFVGTTAGGWPAGLTALVSIFLPGLLLVAGVAPWWDKLKTQPGTRAALSGVSAVVVGVLAAALWNPMLAESIARPADWALFAAAYVFLAMARFPPWLVVIGFATATGFVSR